jgi:uncharacterized membrane protein
MAKGKLDPIDGIVTPAFAYATYFVFGLAGSLPIRPNDVLWSAQGAEVSVAFLLGFFAIGAAWASNRPQLSDLDGPEFWAPALTLALFMGVGLMPILRDLILSSWIFGAVATSICAIGFAIIGYY